VALEDAQARELYDLTPLGTKIIIQP